MRGTIQMMRGPQLMQFPTSDANDFEFYTIWVLDEQIDDLEPLFDITGTDSTSCGCLVISNQFIDEENSPYQLVITSALYGLSSLESGEVDLEVRELVQIQNYSFTSPYTTTKETYILMI